ncbi:hypothetical protein PO124_34395 [Bacillus licheniformis]|nr:hypothetical protein [Bacillus licheniformis]
MPEKDEYTGRVMIREVTYMTDYAQKITMWLWL